MIQQTIGYMNRFYWGLLALGLMAGLGQGCRQETGPSSTAAEKALASFRLPPGFRIDLVAAEPLVADPVAMTIDEWGRMYVVEMHGYPLDLSHTGKVILLEDADGDGRMDTRKVFADSLTLPTGIMRWKQGVLVTDAPNVYYLEDSTGDGRADIRRVVLTGFALTNPQYLVNHPLYGLDNWIYLAHEGAEETRLYPAEFGDTGTVVRYADSMSGPQLPANAQGRIVRFRPDKRLLEECSGATQFGQSFDAWGHHFLVSNANHIYQEVLAAPYLNRNPGQMVGDVTQSLSDHGEACEVFPMTIHPEHQLLTDVGVITSACGINIYLGGAFPAPYNGGDISFVCEPASNLVHADRLVGRGASFNASRVLEGKEFLASTDAWFRPVNLYVGPDGSLYVVDYYREIIEHPEWMSAEAAHSSSLYNGRDMGRIYRISRQDAAPSSEAQAARMPLGGADTKELVQRLADPNIWWRRNAQRLLVDRRDDTAVPALTRMATQPDSPLGRLHALWTLEGMQQLSTDLIRGALQDPVAGLRENAIRLAERHLASDTGLVSALLALQNDPDPQVRYQLLCTLGSVQTAAAAGARQTLLFRDLGDPWVQVAALSAEAGSSDSLLATLLERYDSSSTAYASFVRRLGAIVGSTGDAATLRPLLQKTLLSPPGRRAAWQQPLAEGLASGLTGRAGVPKGLAPLQDALVQACLTLPQLPLRTSARKILGALAPLSGRLTASLVRGAQQQAADSSLPAGQRAEALRLLALGHPAARVAFLRGFIRPAMPAGIQEAALEVLSAIPGATVSRIVLEHWEGLTPELRNAALNTFLTEPFQPSRLKLLLDALEGGSIDASALGWPRTVILMRDIPDTLKARARALLASPPVNRDSLFRAFSRALTLPGNVRKGQRIYENHCLICHRVRGKFGVDFGPDLGTIKNWAPENILINILDPNLSISHGYELWNLVLADGSTLQGIIASETPQAIVLRKQGGAETVLARRDIRSLRSLGMSAMPADFGQKITPEQMADLLAFLRGATP